MSKYLFSPSRQKLFFHWQDIAQVLLPSAIVTLIFYLALFKITLPHIESRLLEDKKEMLHELTISVINILNNFEELEESGQLTRPQAQKAAIDQIRKIRYGNENKDYFWINDLTPLMVMHPYRTDLEGENVSDFSDPTGKHLFLAFVETVRASPSGDGYVPYQWQWKDDPSRIVAKLSYVKLFAPWGWIIGTGIYLEDVQAEITAMTKALHTTSAALFLIVLLLTFAIVRHGLKTAANYRQAADEVSRQRDSLENDVQERTRELQDTNERLEEEIGVRRDVEQELREQHAFLETVIESLPFPFTVIDAQTYAVKKANAIAAHGGDWAGLSCHLLTHNSTRPCNGESHLCPLTEVARTKKSVVTEHVHCDLDGHKRYYEIHGFPILDKSGNVAQMIEAAFDITEKKELEKKLINLSITDSLTNIYNRRGFFLMGERQMQVARRRQLCYHLFFADMDNLKTINDTLGHEAGDKAIIEMGQLLKDTFRQEDIIGRLGGDEFAVMFMEAEEGIYSSRPMLARFEEKIAQANMAQGRLFPISMSYGVVSTDSADLRSLDQVLAEADQLMYSAKQQKKEKAAP